MPMHASWKGHLKISLASIPVQAFTATAGTESSDLSLNQLHSTCKSRIKYKKVCPIHGEVPNTEIVSGYEFAKNQYVIIDRDELAEMAVDLEKTLTIERFVPPDTIDPRYAAGQTYYLVPDGRVGQQPYVLICEALRRAQLHGLGEMVISRKQRLVRLRASDKLIVIDVLHYEGELRSPVDLTGNIPKIAISAPELKLAQSLVEQMKEPEFDASQYTDEYMERMKSLIDSKVKGKAVAAPQPDESPAVLNFMDALKKSVKSVATPKNKAVAVPKKKTRAPKEASLKSTARRTPPARKPTRAKTG